LITFSIAAAAAAEAALSVTVTLAVLALNKNKNKKYVMSIIQTSDPLKVNHFFAASLASSSFVSISLQAMTGIINYNLIPSPLPFYYCLLLYQ